MDELDSFVNYLEKQYSVDDNRLQSKMQTLKRKLNVFRFYAGICSVCWLILSSHYYFVFYVSNALPHEFVQIQLDLMNDCFQRARIVYCSCQTAFYIVHKDKLLDSFVNYLEKQYSIDDNRLQSEMQTLKRKLNVKVKTRKNVLSALCVCFTT
jgi:hypothetical protein